MTVYSITYLFSVVACSVDQTLRREPCARFLRYQQLRHNPNGSMDGRFRRRGKAPDSGTLITSKLLGPFKSTLRVNLYMWNQYRSVFHLTQAAKLGSYTSMEEQRRRKRREEKILETAIAAVWAALLVSGLNKILPYIPMKCPSPLLFLLLNIIIASIVIISTTQQDHSACHSHRRSVAHRRIEQRKRNRVSSKIEDKWSGDDDQEEEGGDAEELNARAEAFITAFRHQLWVDSFGSKGINDTYLVYCTDSFSSR